MPKRKAPKTWAEQLADLNDPTPKDFDPEEYGQAFEQGRDSSDEAAQDTTEEAREHYEVVGKSKLRKPEQLNLGKEYTGSQISRNAFIRGDSDEDPFGPPGEDEIPASHGEGSSASDAEIEGKTIGREQSSDGKETFERFGDDRSKASGFKPRDLVADGDSIGDMDSASQTFDEDMEPSTNGAGDLQSPSPINDDEDVTMDAISESDSDTSSTSSSAPSLNSAPQTKQSAQRAELRKIMAESQKAIVSNISAAAKADAAKGKAIKKQRSAFDGLLNTRIRLQKALVATNSLAMTSTEGEDTKAIVSAEQAALNLWNTIDSLRRSLPSSSPSPPITATTTTSLSTLWQHTHEPTTASLPAHREILTKWSNKINPPAAALLTQRNKFSQAPSQQPLTAVLDAQLTGIQGQKNIDKARTPRSCAPLQAQADHAFEAEKRIYDDSDFYTSLLRELVQQRSSSSLHTNPMPTPLLPGIKDRSLRVKKNVDTKASKGRKIRYTVHEKLQNFMAPEDRGTWGERQRGELFGGLLGRRVEMGEGEGMDIDGNGDEEGMREEEALMLFRR